MSLRATVIIVVGLIGLALVVALRWDAAMSANSRQRMSAPEAGAPTSRGDDARPFFLFENGVPKHRRGDATREYDMPGSGTTSRNAQVGGRGAGAHLAARLRAEYDLAPDTYERMRLAAAFGECAGAGAGWQMLDLINREEDADVRLALLRALGQWAGRAQMTDEIRLTLQARFAAVEGDLTERVAVLETIGELPDAQATAFLQMVAMDPASDPAERAAAAAALLRQHEAGWPPAAATDVQTLRALLVLDAHAAADAPTRLLAVLALAHGRSGGVNDFSGMLPAESNEALRQVRGE